MTMDRDLEAPWISNPEPYRNEFFYLVEEPNMSDLWAYDPDKCDGDWCPCDCDSCYKSEIVEEDEDEEDG